MKFVQNIIFQIKSSFSFYLLYDTVLRVEVHSYILQRNIISHLHVFDTNLYSANFSYILQYHIVSRLHAFCTIHRTALVLDSLALCKALDQKFVSLEKVLRRQLSGNWHVLQGLVDVLNFQLHHHLHDEVTD